MLNLGLLYIINSDNKIIRMSIGSNVPISKYICDTSSNRNQKDSINSFWVFKKNPLTIDINPK